MITNKNIELFRVSNIGALHYYQSCLATAQLCKTNCETYITFEIKTVLGKHSSKLKVPFDVASTSDVIRIKQLTSSKTSAQ